MTERPTIFIVDDDAGVRKGLSLSLKERDYQVASFESAQDYLDSPNNDRPGCLLLDIRMPHMSGLELQDEMIKRGIKTPIIFLTGHGDIPMTVRAIRKGAIDFLEKPYKLDILMQRIEEALAVDAKIRAVDAEKMELHSRLTRLTARELEVMTLIVAGAANTSNRVVAQRLGISHRTVDSYRARVMEKMQASSLPDLVAMAKTCGIYRAENP